MIQLLCHHFCPIFFSFQTRNEPGLRALFFVHIPIHRNSARAVLLHQRKMFGFSQVSLLKVEFESIEDLGCLWLFTIYKKLRKIQLEVCGTRLFESFRRKISGSNGTSEKAVLFFRTECSKRKFVFHFFKAISDTILRPSWSFFGNWILFVQMLNARNSARREKKRPTKEALGE